MNHATAKDDDPTTRGETMSQKNLCLVLCLLIGMSNVSPVYSQLVRINFQPPGEVPAGYLPDYGEVFGDRGNGFSCGWNTDKTGDMYKRHSSSFADQKYDTLVRRHGSKTRSPVHVSTPEIRTHLSCMNLPQWRLYQHGCLRWDWRSRQILSWP